MHQQQNWKIRICLSLLINIEPISLWCSVFLLFIFSSQCICLSEMFYGFISFGHCFKFMFECFVFMFPILNGKHINKSIVTLLCKILVLRLIYILIHFVIEFKGSDNQFLFLRVLIWIGTVPVKCLFKNVNALLFSRNILFA